MERKVYRSRISVLMMGFILLCFLPALIPMISSGNVLNPVFYILVGSLAFVMLIALGMRCEITDKHLIISTWGTCKVNCPLSQIVSVERSYNMLSSGAFSLKRLSIRSKKGSKYPWMLISPVREQEFLDTLKKYNPDIYVRVENKTEWWRIWDWDL